MASFADRIYRRASVRLQHLLVSAYGLSWKRLRFGGVFQQELRHFRDRERFSADEWQGYSNEQLRSLLVLAFEHVPYYISLGQSLGFSVADLKRFTVEDLKTLPSLEKATARDAPNSLLVNGHPNRRHLVFHTSGSSGTPVPTYWLPNELQRSLALREARSCGFAGVSFKIPRATFSGRIVEPNPDSKGPFYRFNLAERQVYFSAFHLRPETAKAYVAALARHKIQWITGYSNSIYQLALMALDQHLPVPPMGAVITTSEKVTTEMRDVIERAFLTRVYEEYGTVEDLFYVCECEYGHKHINPDAGILEIVDENNIPVPPGQDGEVLATGFIRTSQPMIRYQIGDRAVMDDQPCPCGRQMPVLREVIGRIEDTVYGPDGRRVVRFHGIFVNQPHVREGQIIQEHLDQIQVKVVPKPGFGTNDEQDIVQRIHQRLASQVRVSVVCVDHIERTATGKFRAVICNLSPEELERVQSAN
jgi:phenylacetate-CoA ligase